MNTWQILKYRDDGMISDQEALAELDRKGVRGAFQGRRFVGYDYRAQKWIEVDFALIAAA